MVPALMECRASINWDYHKAVEYHVVLWEPVMGRLHLLKDIREEFPEEVNFNMRATGWVELGR